MNFMKQIQILPQRMYFIYKSSSVFIIDLEKRAVVRSEAESKLRTRV